MQNILRLIILLTLSVGISAAQAQKKDSVKVFTKVDTAKAKKPAVADAKDKKIDKIKPYREVITDKAVSDDGVFTVHKVEEKYYFEIPDKALKKEFLVVSRLTKAGAGMRSGNTGYAGDQIGENLIAFEKGPQDKIFIRSISYADYARDSTSAMYNSVMRNNIQAIIHAFDIKAYGKDKKSSVIDVTSLVNGDSDLVSFDNSRRRSFRVGGFQSDKSFINFVKSYPTNIEINATKTFTKSSGGAPPPPGSASEAPAADNGNYTVEINSSFVLLPEDKMQPRYYDPRVGYFSVGYTDFDLDPQGVKRVSLIKRWRLEPKPQDLDKYKRGELVEPAKPIVFYIDPATPKKWIPYLIQGVNDWQKAFERAGFKNAIYAKLPDPKTDPEWNLADARFSAIVYKPSDVPNASGPSISDPRTGEILESHINWYHNVMLLLRNWYFVQAAPNDPRARKLEFDDKLMGELIRFVSSHEVGHTLGLRHNFGASASVPVEKLRDRNYLAKYGHTPSIMDYARFNYVAQPEDRVGDLGLMPRIGDYDEWAIEWGYRRFPNLQTPEAEKPKLNAWVVSKLKNPRLWFGTETNPLDPRSQSEQVGDDAMVAGGYGVKNLERIVNNLQKWTTKPSEDYAQMSMMYNQVTLQFSRYLGHAAKYIGGRMETPKTVEQNGPVFEVVPAAQQREALNFLSSQIFETPHWLIDSDVFNKTGNTPISVVEKLQDDVLDRILSPIVLQSMYQSESLDQKGYQLQDYLAELKAKIFNGTTPDLYRRNLQRNYLDTMMRHLGGASVGSATANAGAAMTVANPSASNSDIGAIVRGILTDLRRELSSNIPDDKLTQYHNADLVYRLSKVLDVKK